MSDFSRRTVVRGTAWTVPVIAVAAQAPAFAVSPPPYVPPVVDLLGSCGNTGVTTKGCGGKFTLQVPVTVSNPTSSPIVFQVTGMYVRKDGVTPTGPGPGTLSGIRGIFSTPSLSEPDENNCTAQTQVQQATCTTGGVSGTPGQVTTSSVVIAANTAAAYFWLESPDSGSADDFTARIEYRLLDAATCTPISGTLSVQTTTTLPSNNCNG